MNLLTNIVGVVFLVGWFGFLGWLVWKGWREVRADLLPDDPMKKQPWTRLEKWLVGLGTGFVVWIALGRISGSSDTQTLNVVSSLVGFAAALAWMFTAFAAVAILVWRGILYVRHRRATRRLRESPR